MTDAQTSSHRDIESVEQAMTSVLQDPRVQRVLRAAAVGSWITITVLSLLPGSERPHTGASGNAEHIMAYTLAALVTRLGFQHVRSRWQLLGFSAASATFEVCQIWIPGRSAGVDNWAASTFGGLLGIVMARAATHIAESRARRARHRRS